MSKKNVLLLFGGDGSEHQISKLSASFIEKSLKDNSNITVTKKETGAEFDLKILAEADFVIPCYHGFPGETGDIQSALELSGTPYLGVGPEASNICFNKVTSKLWFTALGIPNTPYKFISTLEDQELAFSALKEWKTVFIKASNQGSSVGCFKVTKESELLESLEKALKLSPYVLIEKEIKGRELEVSAYELDGKLYTSAPGEILCPEGEYYSYDEKYADKSLTSTALNAEGLSKEQLLKIEELSVRVFKGLKLRDLSRIDYFLTFDGEIILNEINTFPGMTEISMFPKMMENNGHKFSKFLTSAIERYL